jgi:hypothetical protein
VKTVAAVGSWGIQIATETVEEKEGRHDRFDEELGSKKKKSNPCVVRENTYER